MRPRTLRSRYENGFPRRGPERQARGYALRLVLRTRRAPAVMPKDPCSFEHARGAPRDSGARGLHPRLPHLLSSQGPRSSSDVHEGLDNRGEACPTWRRAPTSPISRRTSLSVRSARTWSPRMARRRSRASRARFKTPTRRATLAILSHTCRTPERPQKRLPTSSSRALSRRTGRDVSRSLAWTRRRPDTPRARDRMAPLHAVEKTRADRRWVRIDHDANEP